MAPDIEAWFAINRLKARYCRLLDTKDWPGFAALFTDDFELDVSDGTGLPVIHGREAAMERVLASIRTATTAHQVHSPEIDIDGERASAVWAMQDRVVWPAEAQGSLASLTGYGHYHERYRRVDGEWKIAASRLTRLRLDLEHASPPLRSGGGGATAEPA